MRYWALYLFGKGKIIYSKQIAGERCALGTPESIQVKGFIFNRDEIQDILSVSKTTVYNLIKSEAFHSVRIGGQYRISKRSFDKWLDEQGAMQVCE